LHSKSYNFYFEHEYECNLYILNRNRKSRRDVLFNASKTMAIPFFGFYGVAGFILSLLSFIP